MAGFFGTLVGTEHFAFQGSCATCYGGGNQGVMKMSGHCITCQRKYEDVTLFSFLLSSALPCGHDPLALTRDYEIAPCSACGGTGKVTLTPTLAEIVREWGRQLERAEMREPSV